MTALILIGIILLCVALGQPVYVLLGSVVAYLLVSVADGGWGALNSIVEQTRGLADKDVLLAIPFFVLAGSLMTEGDIAKRLIGFARSVFGWLPGGLAISATFACVLFAAISGSSPVTVIAIGSIMYPALVKDGYSDRFSSGLVTSAGSLGILIPPSIPMIVYAIADPTAFGEPMGMSLFPDSVPMADRVLSVRDLFLAGVGPGMMIALIFSAFSVVEGVRRKVPRSKLSFREVGRAFWHGIWALLLPVLILGGIYSGAFTATEAACVAVVYALAVELYIHRSIKWADCYRIFADSMVLIGSLLLILAVAQGFNKFITQTQLAERAAEWLFSADVGPVAFLLIVNGLLLVAGCFMDILSAILILVPLLAPIGLAMGIHPLLMGVVFIVNLEIGYLTPPLGINLFVASTLFRKGLGDIIRSVAPFTLLMLVALVLTTYIPTISLGPVALSKGGDFFVPFPEPHIPMHELGVPAAIELMANMAADPDVEEEVEEQIDARPMTLAEIMAQANETLEEEALAGLQYENLGELLYDFRCIADGRVRLRDLLRVRESGGENNPCENVGSNRAIEDPNHPRDD